MEPMVEARSHSASARHVEAATVCDYATVVIDADSSLAGINGIQWLAEQRGDVVARKVANLAAQASEGVIAAEEALHQQLLAIRPRRTDVDALSRAYVDAMAPGAADTLARLRRAGVRVILMSAGLRHALYGLSYRLGIDAQDVHALGVRFDALGAFLGYDRESPLIAATGKRIVLSKLAIDRPVLAIGSGPRDIALRDVVDSFVAFTGFVEHEDVVRHADASAKSFKDLASLLFHSSTHAGEPLFKGHS